MKRKRILNAAIEDDLIVLYYVGRSAAGTDEICRIQAWLTSEFEDEDALREKIMQTNVAARRDGLPSLGFASLEPIDPPDPLLLEHLQKQSALSMRWPRESLGKYDGNDIPPYVILNGRRYDFSGVYQKGMQIDDANQFVDGGLIFEAAESVAPATPKPR